MLQHFYSEEAVRYNSMEIAVILQKFRELLHYNKMLNQHLINNVYWLKITEQALTELFPFIEKGKLMRTLYRMKELGLILQKQDQSNTYWFTLIELPTENSVAVQSSLNQAAIPANAQAQAFVNGQQVEPASKRLWSDVNQEFIAESVAKLVAKHGYDQQHFFDIWHTFASSMDANGEQPPARMDLIQKRFIAYANKVQMNLAHGNRRYQQTYNQTAEKREKAVEAWLQYIDKMPPEFVYKVDSNGLQASLDFVWNCFIRKSYEKQIPLKNSYQLENGFSVFVNTWRQNEVKDQKKQNYQGRSSYQQVDHNDTSWADDIDLEGL